MPRLSFAALALLLLVPSLVPAPAAAQEEIPAARDAVYLELLGNGLFYSVNYDRRITDRWSGRVGLTVIGAVAAPVMANYLLGSGSHRLELGAGVLLVSAGEITAEAEGESEDLNFATGTATMGYRYQPRDGGFVFRLGFTPLLTLGGGLPWAGISFGYAFR